MSEEKLGQRLVQLAIGVHQVLEKKSILLWSHYSGGDLLVFMDVLYFLEKSCLATVQKYS